MTSQAVTEKAQTTIPDEAKENGSPGTWTTAGLIKRLNDQRKMLENIQSRLNELNSITDTQATDIPQIDLRLIGIEKNIEFVLLAHKKLADVLVKLRERVAQLERDVQDPGRHSSTRTFSALQARPSTTLSKTGFAVLKLLSEDESKTSTQISRTINRSREHTARLMKHLRDQGLVTSQHNRIPAQFALTDEGRNALASFG
ncbi:MAG: winged helix DNA-binding protein [archaeon]